MKLSLYLFALFYLCVGNVSAAWIESNSWDLTKEFSQGIDFDYLFESSISVSSNGEFLAVQYQSKSNRELIDIIDLRLDKRIQTISPPGKNDYFIGRAQFSPSIKNSSDLLFGFGLWSGDMDIYDGRQLNLFKVSRRSVLWSHDIWEEGFEFSPNGEYISMFSSYNFDLRSVADGEIFRTIEIDQPSGPYGFYIPTFNESLTHVSYMAGGEPYSQRLSEGVDRQIHCVFCESRTSLRYISAEELLVVSTYWDESTRNATSKLFVFNDSTFQSYREVNLSEELNFLSPRADFHNAEELPARFVGKDRLVGVDYHPDTELTAVVAVNLNDGKVDRLAELKNNNFLIHANLSKGTVYIFLVSPKTGNLELKKFSEEQ